MTEAKPNWMKTKPAEMEKIVLELAKQGESPAKIGLILRDQHGIPKAKLLGKKISKIFEENGLDSNHERNAITGKIKKLESHIKKNKYDNPAQKSLTKKLWVLRNTEA